MRKWLHARIWWVFPTLVLAASIWIVASAKSFQQCIREIKSNETQQFSKQSISYLLIVFGRYKACSGVFLVEYRDAVIALGTLGLMFFTGTLWWATKGLQRFAEIQSRDMVRSIRAAEAAAAASVEALAHARETAERDFRPWLTLNARLISPVDKDPIRHNYEDDEEGVAFFIELRCRNVGKVAALNVIYSVSGIDIAHNEDSVWLQELIDASVHACKFAGPQSWMADHSLEWSYDSLAPSEEYKAKRWCQIAPLKPDSVWRSVPKERRIYRFCVGIVAAYSSTSGHIFYTAKVLPVGKVNLPEFLGLIRHTEIPIGIDEVGLGPTYKAIAT